MITTTPSTCGKLQANVQAYLNRWMGPCYTAPYEHITASANTNGEVYLSGLVNDHQIVDEAMDMLKQLPGVKVVADRVTIVCKGNPVTL